MKVSTSLPFIDTAFRQSQAQQNRLDTVQRERQEKAQQQRDASARQQNDRASESKQVTYSVEPRNQQRATETPADARPNFYKFKDPTEYPSATRRALAAYEGNQRAAERPPGADSVLSGVDFYV